MKKFKDLANNIGLYEHESGLGGEHTFGGGFNNINQQASAVSAISGAGIYNIQKQSQLNRINSFLDAFSKKEYIDPRAALGMLRAKLNIAGLDFEFNMKANFNDEGVNLYPITRFGGTFGKGLDTPFDEFETTDGISDYNDGKGFHLNVTSSTTANGTYKLNTKIEPDSSGIVVVAVEDDDDNEEE
jgi:hypothetical protein